MVNISIMMSPNCEINLDNPSGRFYSGEMVNGHIYLTLPEPVLIKAIALQANGFACSSWEKPKKQKKQKPNKKPEEKKQAKEKPQIIYEKRVDYFAKVEYFVGSEEALPQLMEAGTYRFDFSVQLPLNCPSSFEGTYGHIRYVLQLMLQKSGDGLVEAAVTRQLQVEQRRDEIQPHFTQPSQAQSSEHFSSMKFWKKPLQLNVNIIRSDYEVGTGIAVHVILSNPQKLPLHTLTYKLNLVSSFVAHPPKKPNRVEIKEERSCVYSCSHQLDTLPVSELLNFQHIQILQVPQSFPNLTATTCACIQLSYEVEVTVQTTQELRFIMTQVPVILANTPSTPEPLRLDNVGCSQCDLVNLNVPSAPSQTPEPSGLETNFSVSMTSLASTQFREANFMVATNLNKKEKHSMSGDKFDFRPRYLYYEMDNTGSTKML